MHLFQLGALRAHLLKKTTERRSRFGTILLVALLCFPFEAFTSSPILDLPPEDQSNSSIYKRPLSTAFLLRSATSTVVEQPFSNLTTRIATLNPSLSYLRESLQKYGLKSFYRGWHWNGLLSMCWGPRLSIMRNWPQTLQDISPNPNVHLEKVSTAALLGLSDTLFCPFLRLRTLSGSGQSTLFRDLPHSRQFYYKGAATMCGGYSFFWLSYEYTESYMKRVFVTPRVANTPFEPVYVGLSTGIAMAFINAASSPMTVALAQQHLYPDRCNSLGQGLKYACKTLGPKVFFKTGAANLGGSIISSLLMQATKSVLFHKD